MRPYRADSIRAGEHIPQVRPAHTGRVVTWTMTCGKVRSLTSLSALPDVEAGPVRPVLIDLVTMVDTLRGRGIGFQVLTGALADIDPGTADGRSMLQVVGAMGESERSLIKERARAGLDAAKAQGRTGGRPTVVDEDVLTVARGR